MEICDKCLYKKNCQFLAKHKQSSVDGCTAFESEKDFRADVIEEYRKRVNAKMGKHTHLLGKEYVQRILREVAKEMKGGAE